MICEYCEHEHTPELARSMVTALEAAEMMGYEPTSGNKIPSLANPGERTPSLHLYDGDGGWWDFSTGKGGDVIDFVMQAGSLTFGRALSSIIHRALKAGKEPGDVERAEPKQLHDFTTQLPDRDDQLVFSWRVRLGVEPPANCRVQDGNLLIPHQDEQGVYGVKVRGQDGSKTAWPGSQFTKRLYDPLGWPETRRDRTGCIITEGESDCWAIRSAMRPNLLQPVIPVTQPWLPVYALPAGAGTFRDHWLKDLEGYTGIWVCMDQDEAGRRARDKIMSKVGYTRCRELRLPGLAKDAREAVGMGWRPDLSSSLTV